MKKIPYTKMHGCGNSFIMIDDWSKEIKRPGLLAKNLCSPAFGIGADGLILLRPASNADCTMDYFNSDGSRSAMCGNGLRCTAAFFRKARASAASTIRIQTGAGVKLVQRMRAPRTAKAHTAELYTVTMGEPRFDTTDFRAVGSTPHSVQIGKRRFTLVSMGNPHAVTFVKDFSFDLTTEGRAVENYRRFFPNRVNVEFIKIVNRKTLRMRVWERGCGVTLACGSGACAAVVAATVRGFVAKEPITVILDGGSLTIAWEKETNQVVMTGPVATVGSGWAFATS